MAEGQREGEQYGECLFHNVTVSWVRGCAKLDFVFPGLLLGGFFGVVELLQILGGVFLEVLEAAFAAEFDLAAFVDKGVGLAHLAEFFTGDDTGLQRVGLGGIRPFGVLGERGEGDADTGEQDDCDE